MQIALKSSMKTKYEWMQAHHGKANIQALVKKKSDEKKAIQKAPSSSLVESRVVEEIIRKITKISTSIKHYTQEH